MQIIFYFVLINKIHKDSYSIWPFGGFRDVPHYYLVCKFWTHNIYNNHSRAVIRTRILWVKERCTIHSSTGVTLWLIIYDNKNINIVTLCTVRIRWIWFHPNRTLCIYMHKHMQLSENHFGLDIWAYYRLHIINR